MDKCVKFTIAQRWTSLRKDEVEVQRSVVRMNLEIAICGNDQDRKK